MKYKLLLLFAFIPFLGVSQSYQKQVKELDQYIQRELLTWNSPGFAVAVVKDGEVLMAKGYGLRTTGTSNQVDEHTLFVCASTTKAFTAAALAILVDEGKVDWNDKVTEHLPQFKLNDVYVTNELTVRDLLTHRSGLGNTDYLWTTMSITSDSAVVRLVDSELSYSLRSSFIYQNLMYLTAGEVVEAASGMPWAEFVKTRIYTPLGMNETFPYMADISNQQNVAKGHYKVEDKIIKIQQLDADAIGPAGSMWSSITDMSKWLQFLDNNGIYKGDTLISQKNFEELFKPQQIVPPNQFYPSMQLTKPSWTTYGLGWFQHDYNGYKVDFHTGSLPGMVAIAGLIRDQNIGVYVFGNLDHVELRHAIMYASFDLLLDKKLSRDWSKELKAIYEAQETEDEEPEQIKEAPASVPIDSLVGIYYNSKHGEVVISRTNDDLNYSLNNTVSGKMEHWHYDTYNISYDRAWYGEGLLTFHRNNDGQLAYLEVWGWKFDLKKED